MTTTHQTMFWTDTNGVANINWTFAGDYYANKSSDELRFVIKDCREAIDAMPEGKKAGYYQDTILICHRILSEREPRAYFNKPVRRMARV